MKQLNFPPTGKKISLDGLQGTFKTLDIWYIGDATELFDGTWRCLANVNGCLCVVEVKLTFKN